MVVSGTKTFYNEDVLIRQFHSICIAAIVCSIFLFTAGFSIAQEPDPSPTTGTTSENPSFTQQLAGFASRIYTLNNPVQLETQTEGFAAAEEVVFEMRIPQKDKNNVGTQKKNTWKTDQEVISVTVTNTDTQLSVPVYITKTETGIFSIAPQKTDDWTPGTYQLEVDARESFFYTRNLEQNFSWGVLSFNTNKSIYTPGETAKLAFGILDEKGHTLCDQPLELVIRAPDNSETVLSRENGGITQSGECSGDSVTVLPDYLAEFKTTETGTYHMVLTGNNKNGTHTISDYFEVRGEVPFEVERTQFPTRVYPVSAYDVSITIRANADYQGIVQDLVPASFLIEEISGNGTTIEPTLEYATPSAAIQQEDAEAYMQIEQKSKLMYEKQTRNGSVDHTPVPITWNVNWKAGQTYTLSYRIHFPVVSPEFFLIGPLSVGDFKEIRQWQVANDATRTWDGGGSTNNWSEAANWSTDAKPGTADVALFNSTSVKDAIINENVSIQCFRIQTGYSGTVTQSGSFTMNIGTVSACGTPGTAFQIQTGTFVGGSGNITISRASHDFNMSGGTFTATSGTIFLSDDFLVTGGTFNHNNGRIDWTDDGDDSYTINVGTRTVYNFGPSSSCGGTFTVNSGSTLTVANTLYTGGSCTGSRMTFNGPGSVVAQANIVTQNRGGTGSLIVTVNGTGNQTLTSESDNDTYFPGITINKTSGTFTLIGNVFSRGGSHWTYTQGVTDFTGTTVGFEENMTIAGNWVFNNVRFANGTYNSGRTINTGTVITVNGTTYLDPAPGEDYVDFYGTGGEIHAKGDIYVTESGIRDSNTVLVINGTGDQLFDSEDDTDTSIPPIRIDKPSGTLTMTGYFHTYHDWDYVQGNLDASASTVFFNEYVEISGSHTLGNVIFCPTDYNTIALMSGTTLSVSGTAYLDHPTDCSSTQYMNLDGPGTLRVLDSLIIHDQGIGGDANITFGGSGDQSITYTGTPVQDVPSGTYTIDKPSGTFVVQADVLLPYSGQDLNVISGTVNLGNYNLTVNDTFTVGPNGTIVLTGDQTISTSSTVFSGSATYTGTGSYSTLKLGNTYNNLTISGAGTYSPTGTVTITGNFTQTAGTFNAPDNLRVGRNITRSGGSFVPGNNTITLIEAGTTSQLSGVNSFYNFTSIVSGKELVFEAGETYTISNALTIRGTKKDPLTLRSSSPGTQWFINAPSGTSGTGLYVADSNACSGNRISATESGGNGNNDCWDFGYAAGISGWYDTNWDYRKKITIDETLVEGTSHTNFPVLVSITTDANLASLALDSGNDILFTDSDGTTQLDHEIELFNGTTGQLIAWVRVPTLSGTESTDLYMYYGNAAAPNMQNPSGVWDNTYNAVWHLNENPGGTAPQILDSTANNRNGTSTGSMTSGDLISGQIRNALDFDTNDAISVPNGAGFNNINTGTISMWVRWNGTQPSGYNSSYGAVSGREQGGVFGNNIIGLNGSNPATAKVMWRFRDAGSNLITSTISPGNGVWRYVTVAFAPGNHRLIIDGQVDGTSTTTASTHDNISIPFTFGAWLGVTHSSSYLDEVRLSNVSRSTEWVQTEYNNMTNSSFLTINSQEEPVQNNSLQIRGGTRIQGGTHLEAN